jgi:hypothetical protein
MQVALNGDEEYVGGRLIYAYYKRDLSSKHQKSTSNSDPDKNLNDCDETATFFVPPRPAGSVTVHTNKVVHGVTTLHSGVRYGLFFLLEAASLVDPD